MKKVQSVQNVFEYYYQPLTNRLYQDDAGFHVELRDDGILIFRCFFLSGAPSLEYAFQLNPVVCSQVRRVIGRADWWISYLQTQRQTWFVPDRPPEFNSGFCFENALFYVEDLPQLMHYEFGNLRGHYGRMMYNLMEDICSVLQKHHFRMTLNSFAWDSAMVTPLNTEPQDMSPEPPEQMMYYGA